MWNREVIGHSRGPGKSANEGSGTFHVVTQTVAVLADGSRQRQEESSKDLTSAEEWLY